MSQTEATQVERKFHKKVVEDCITLINQEIITKGYISVEMYQIIKRQLEKAVMGKKDGILQRVQKVDIFEFF